MLRLTAIVLVAAAFTALPAAATPSARTAPVPILMYHLVTTPPSSAPLPGLYVPRKEFAAEVAWLAAHGYHGVTLQRVYDHWRDGKPLPAHPVVFTFDDGYRSVYLNAFPVLKARHWPGVINLAVKNERHSWGLLPRVLRVLLRSGWELDSHTINHRDLTSLGAAELKHEVAGSRSFLRAHYRVPVNFLCYPSGRYDAAVIAAVQAAGYLGATSTREGLARPSEIWTLGRVRVSGGDGAAGLAAKLHALGV